MIRMFKYTPSWSERIKEAIRPTPMKRRLNNAIHRMSVQMRRMDSQTNRLQSREKNLYTKCVGAIQAKDSMKASMYADECAEIRKMVLNTLKSQMALERVSLKLTRVRDFGELAYNMTSVGAIMKQIKDGIQNIMPEISMELANVNETLHSISLEIGEVTEQTIDYDVPTEESEKIMKEAALVAEQKMQERFPDMPKIPSPEPDSSVHD